MLPQIKYGFLLVYQTDDEACSLNRMAKFKRAANVYM